MFDLNNVHYNFLLVCFFVIELRDLEMRFQQRFMSTKSLVLFSYNKIPEIFR
jgi:hypothetical protein